MIFKGGFMKCLVCEKEMLETDEKFKNKFCSKECREKVLDMMLEKYLETCE